MYRLILLMGALLLAVGVASAAVVTLPNETQTTTFTATVSEQANVAVPAGVAFAVTNVSASTASSAQSVSATAIVLTNAKALRVELQAIDTSFTAPTGGSVTWYCSDVSWNAATWTNGTGASGTLTDSMYRKLNDTSANAASTATTNLVFTLAARATVDRAGAHTLFAEWKFSSF